MNSKVLLAFSLAGVVSAQAGLDGDYLDRLSPKARAFVEKYKAEKANKKLDNSQKRKVVVKRDVLGRSVKRGQSQDSTVYVVDNAVEPKMEVTVFDLSLENESVENLGPAHYSYNEKTKEENFWLNGKKMDKKSFLKKTEDWENRRMKLQKPFKQPYKAFLTPTEIERKLQSSEDVYIDEPMEQNETANFIPFTYSDPLYGTVSSNFATKDEVLVISQLGVAHANGDKGDNIGIYYVDAGCASASLIPNSSKHRAMACNRKNQTHASQVTTVLQTFAPNAVIYGYDSQNFNMKSTPGPSNPTGSSFNPKIYIGTMSIGVYDESLTGNYEKFDAALDNYIFANGVTEFINAGNYTPSLQSQRTIHSPGKAVNAITVGSYNPYPFYLNGSTVPTYIYEAYSNFINSDVGTAKPEIMNIGSFSLPNGNYTGTSFSTPFTAAVAADLMTRHPFFKGHPEMVKPVFLTATWGTTYNNYDTDRGAIGGIPAYNFMAFNKTFSGYWPKAKDNALFKNANGNDKTLDVTFNGLVAGEKYKLAVSYLTKGSVIQRLKKMPARLSISVYQDGKRISGLNTTYAHQFIMQSFTVPKSGSVTMKISRLSNLAPDDDIAIGYHMALETTP